MRWHPATREFLLPENRSVRREVHPAAPLRAPSLSTTNYLSADAPEDIENDAGSPKNRCAFQKREAAIPWRMSAAPLRRGRRGMPAPLRGPPPPTPPPEEIAALPGIFAE